MYIHVYISVDVRSIYILYPKKNKEIKHDIYRVGHHATGRKSGTKESEVMKIAYKWMEVGRHMLSAMSQKERDGAKRMMAGVF